MAATPKPLRKSLKKETLKIREKHKEDLANKTKHKEFNKWAKGMYKHDLAVAKANKKDK